MSKHLDGCSETTSGQCAKVTFFQASPLAYYDKNSSTRHRVAEIDLKSREREISEVFRESYSNNRCSFKIATKPELKKHLTNAPAKEARQALHISSHGGKNQLALENGFGIMKPLHGSELLQWFKESGGFIPFVFIGSCQSKSVAEDILNADGVNHVISVANDEMSITTSFELQFSLHFYKKCLSGSTIREAFDYASNELSFLFPQQKFCLLPEGSDIHDVPLFIRTKRAHSDDHIESHKPKKACWNVPKQDIFVRSDDLKFKVVQAVQNAKVVWVVGPPGVGKTSLAIESCRYLKPRLSDINIEEIRWKTIGSNALVKSDTDCWLDDLSKFLESLKRHSSLPVQHYELIESLKGKFGLVVIDVKCIPEEGKLSQVSALLDVLIQHTNCKALVIPRTKDIIMSAMDHGSVFETIEVTKLNLESSITLFGTHCQWVKQHARPGIGSQYELWKLFNNLNSFTDPQGYTDLNKKLNDRNIQNRRHRAIYKLIGNGNARDIVLKARVMDKATYRQFIHLCSFYELDEPKMQSHHTLLRYQLKLVPLIPKSIAKGDDEEADRLESSYNCIEWVRNEYSNICRLRIDLRNIRDEIRDRPSTNLLRKLSDINVLIMKEVNSIFEKQGISFPATGIGNATLEESCRRQVKLEKELQTARSQWHQPMCFG